MLRVMKSNSSNAPAISRHAPIACRQTPGEQGSSRLEINLIFTDQQATLFALEAVESLSRDLGACIRLRATTVVPYALPVDEPPVSVVFLESSLFDLISRLERDGFEATAHLYFCRDREKALLQVLAPNALVVIGAKKRWWPTDASRLVKTLRSAGRRVVFVDSTRRTNRRSAEGKQAGTTSSPVHSVPSFGSGTGSKDRFRDQGKRD
jgi:hypothetical protein